MSFRNTTDYNIYLHHFDDAVEKIWPEGSTIPLRELEGSCNKLSQDPKDLERLIMASYRLMKCIRSWLAKKDLPFTQAHKFPNLYTAIENAVYATTHGKGSLAIEASRLEQCSRAAFHWLQTAKKLGRTPTKQELEPPKKQGSITGHGTKKIYCYCCKTNLATDDANMLCSECSGLDSVPLPKGKCSLCGAPCIQGLYFCDLCEVYAKKCRNCKMPCRKDMDYCDMCKSSQPKTPDKQTTIIIERPERGHVGGPITRLGTDIDGLQHWGDMMLPGRRYGVH